MEELISKRAVIEAIEKARANVGHNLERSIGKSIIEILDDVGRDVDRLPSEQLGTNLAEVGTDCISREQAIDALRNYLVGKDVHCDGTMMARLIENEVINKLPFAQPYTYWKEQCQSYEQTINKLRESLSAKSESFEWCTDCKEYDQEKHCCPRWNKVIKKTIDEMKPQIVHCGECRHYVFIDDRMDRFPIRGCSVTGFRDVDAGDFCSRAERREVTT